MNTATRERGRRGAEMWLVRILSALLASVLVGCVPADESAGIPAQGEVPSFRSATETLTWSDTRRITEAFRRALERIRDREGLPGAIAAFALPSGRIVVASTGFADVEAELPMAPHNRLQSGSIGKTFVAGVAISLALEGKLDLDAPAQMYLGDRPWFTALPNHERITVRHLLTHSSGLADHVYDTDFAAAVRELLQNGDAGATLTPEELIAFILDDEPLFEPGAGYAYTDTGYLVLGRVLEAAAGASYFEELERRILVPLELEQTVPAVPEVAFRAAGYMAMDNDFGLPRKTVQDGVMVFNPEVEWTGGGLTTNPADLVKWARELYEGRAFDGDYLDELIGSGVPTGPDGSSAYGLGVRIRDTEFGPSYGDSGWFPGYRSAMWYYPDHGVAVAFQTNTDVDVDLDAWLPELTSTLLRAVTAPRPRTP